jgi:hypothetical protein
LVLTFFLPGAISATHMHKCLHGKDHKSTLKLGRVCAYIVREKIAVTVDSFR